MSDADRFARATLRDVLWHLAELEALDERGKRRVAHIRALCEVGINGIDVPLTTRVCRRCGSIVDTTERP